MKASSNRITAYMIALLACTAFSNRCRAQDNFGLNFLGMTWHFGGDEMARLQPNRLVEDATWVPNWGAVAHYERFICKKRLSIKLATAAYSDCARLFAGHTHLAFRLNVLNGDRHALRLGFGPTVVYRESWFRFPGYVQQNQYLKTKGNWQYAFVWYGGELEYDYRISKKLDINFHFIPGYPDFATMGIGFRYWLRPVPPNKFWKQNPAVKKWFYRAGQLQ